MDFKKTAGVDLHIHSNASDGTFSPQDIIIQAAKQGLKAISITDHDTVSGLIKLIGFPIPTRIQFLTGVEISAAYPLTFGHKGSLHILGYAINPHDSVLDETLSILQSARENRNPLIIEKLKNLNFNITLEEVKNDTSELQIGRPHIARTMVRKKMAASIDEAFDLYLGHNRPAYVDKHRIECEKAIQMIQNAGGVAVLAHPYLLPQQEDGFIEKLVKILKEMGLMGIEVYYPLHPPEITRQYAEMADRLGLLKTGGTDFHGDLTPEIQMGTGKGDFNVPFEVYEKLIAAIPKTSFSLR